MRLTTSPSSYLVRAPRPDGSLGGRRACVAQGGPMGDLEVHNWIRVHRRDRTSCGSAKTYQNTIQTMGLNLTFTSLYHVSSPKPPTHIQQRLFTCSPLLWAARQTANRTPVPSFPRLFWITCAPAASRRLYSSASCASALDASTRAAWG